MSNALLIAYGGRAPVEPTENRKFHQTLLDDLHAEIGRVGWAGADFCHYARADNRVSIEIVPGTAPLSLERLAQFREEQRKNREGQVA